jgi:predicted transglutaminase-like cysteine proteinase
VDELRQSERKATSHRRPRRKLRVVVVTALAAILATVGVVAATSSPAGASTPSVVSWSSAPLDWCPGNAAICQDSQELVSMPPGTPLTMVCWVNSRPTGYGSNRWFYIISGGFQGFTKAELVANQVPTPWCLDNATQLRRGIAASLQATALSEINQVYPTAVDKATAKNVYGFNNWGAYSDWSGDCVMFVGLSWWRAGQKIHSGSTASVIAGTYALSTSIFPPRGAAVFWYYGSVGHVAISLGNGKVATTQGLDGDLKPTVPMWISTENLTKTYRGWVQIP